MSETLDFSAPPAVAASLTFFVPGLPAPGGSKRFVGIGKKTGRGILIDAGGQRNKDWRASVAYCGMALGVKPATGPLCACMEFKMPRPKHHYHTSKKRAGQLREDAPTFHTIAPDTTKLVRSTEDALTGVLWADDSQIAVQSASKTYGERPGCKITVTQL
jgi:Holliday junction resolvase RusA-like endonuclease